MDKIVEIKDLLAEVLSKMGFNYSKISVNDENGIVRANIESEEAALLIGAQGKNLEAIQHILKSLLYKKLPDEKIFLIIDIEDFKKRKQEQILDLARSKADAVKATKITQVLPVMNSFLRRLIHLEFTKPEYAEITTDSIGETGNRRIRIIWKGDGTSTTVQDLDEE